MALCHQCSEAMMCSRQVRNHITSFLNVDLAVLALVESTSVLAPVNADDEEPKHDDAYHNAATHIVMQSRAWIPHQIC